MSYDVELTPLSASHFEAFPEGVAALEVYLHDQDRGARWVRVALVDGEPAGYVTLLWESEDAGLRDGGIPEISDLVVLPAWRRRGIGGTLLDAAEAKAAARGDVVGLGVGLHSGYGPAQRLYARRGYVPDGHGVVVEGVTVPEGASITLDDDPVVTLRLTKSLVGGAPPAELRSGSDARADGRGDASGPMPTLETERLVMRPFTLLDADALQSLAGDRRIAATTLTVPHPYEDGMAEAWIGTHQALWQEGTGVILAITTPDEGLVGAMGLEIEPEHRRAELGYWVGVPFWGRGWATEAGRAMIDFGFDGLGLNRIEAQYLTGNPASGRVLEKLGMRPEGVRRAAIVKWGQAEDVAHCAVLAADRG